MLPRHGVNLHGVGAGPLPVVRRTASLLWVEADEKVMGEGWRKFEVEA